MATSVSCLPKLKKKEAESRFLMSKKRRNDCVFKNHFLMLSFSFESKPPVQKQPLGDVLQNSVPQNFSIFTGKQLYWSHFLIK